MKSAYLDGELCALDATGAPVFSRPQAVMDEGRTGELVYFAFDLLHLNGKSLAEWPLVKRKEPNWAMPRRGRRWSKTRKSRP